MKDCYSCDNTGLSQHDIGGGNLRTAYCDCPWGELRKEEEEAAYEAHWERKEMDRYEKRDEE